MEYWEIVDPSRSGGSLQAKFLFLVEMELLLLKAFYPWNAGLRTVGVVALFGIVVGGSSLSPSHTVGRRRSYEFSSGGIQFLSFQRTLPL